VINAAIKLDVEERLNLGLEEPPFDPIEYSGTNEAETGFIEVMYRTRIRGSEDAEQCTHYSVLLSERVSMQFDLCEYDARQACRLHSKRLISTITLFSAIPIVPILRHGNPLQGRLPFRLLLPKI